MSEVLVAQLQCLFTVEVTVEVTKKNLATCPERMKRHVSKCYVTLEMHVHLK